MRMRLEKIELCGFKTFKNKTVINFPYKFSAIVGPNGSGKSNLIDAILFALGRSRGLRVNKITDLLSITNDGTVEDAYVSLYFSNETKQNIENEKNIENIIKITRTINIDGKSTYRLNDKITTREKITELIGDNEYTILLQNDIAQFIEMNPIERRKIIDEICGIADYDEKKENAIKELSIVENKISEKNIMLEEKKISLQKLEIEKNDAILYNESNLKIKYFEKNLLLRNLTKVKEDMDKLMHLKEELKSKKDEYKNLLDNLQKEKEENGIKISQLHKSIFLKQNEKIKIGEISLALESKNLRDAKKNLNECIENINKLIVKKDSENEKINELNKKIFEIKQKIDAIDEKIEKFRHKEILENIEKIDDEIYHTKIEIEKIINQKNSLENELNIKNKKIETLKEQITKILLNEQNLARKIDDKNFEYKSIYEEIEKNRKERLNAEKEYEELMNKYEKLKEDLIYKKELIKNFSEDPIINYLKSALDGIYGKVSDIIKIPNQTYTKAIFAAAGGRINNIVVENVDVAIKSINLIKKAKLGKATFLPLEKIAVREIKNENLQSTEKINLVKDFVQTAEKFKKIIDYVFSDTIVVNDVEEFKKYMNKYRVVSIDGDLAEKSGAITGGYIKQQINYQQIKEEISEIEKQLQDIEKKLAMLKEKIKQKDEEKEKEIVKIATEIEKIKIEKAMQTKEREEKNIEKQNLENAIKEHIETINQFDKNLEILKNKLQILESQRQKLNKELKENGYEEIEKIKDEKRNLEIEKGILENNILLAKNNIKEIEKELENLRIKEKEYQTNIENLAKNIENLKQKIRENDEIRKKIDEEININKKEIENYEKRSGEILSNIKSINDKISNINDALEKILVEETRLKSNTESINLKIAEYNNINFGELVNKMNLENLSDEDLVKEIEKLKKIISEIGNVNLKAIEDYEKAYKEYEDVKNKIEVLKNEKQVIYDFIANVERKRREVFMNAFEIIKKNFEEIFKKLTDGYGTLTLDNPKEISKSGLLIHANPKGKSVKILDAMSGGEKALTTLAFMLAIQRYKPSFFYVLDELDAALDAENADKFGKMIKESDAQFLIISHNENVIKYSDACIGIAIKDGCSKVVGVKIS